jgi:hypothetical protein
MIVISVRGSFEPRARVRLKGLGNLIHNNLNILSYFVFLLFSSFVFEREIKKNVFGHISINVSLQRKMHTLRTSVSESSDFCKPDPCLLLYDQNVHDITFFRLL